MNAAARLVQQNVLSRHFAVVYLLTRRQMVMIALIFAILASGVLSVYMTQAHRSLYSGYEKQLNEQTYLTNLNSQLLLERSTLMRQSRVQLYAEGKLDMFVPQHSRVVIIRE